MEGLTPLDGLSLLQNSFVSGGQQPDRIQCRYFSRDSDAAIVAKVRFGPGCEGPPGHAHGGSLAAVLDEAMGLSAWLAGYRVVAARLTTDFKKVLKLGTDATTEAWVETTDGRKVTVRGRISSPDGTVHAEAVGLYVELGSSKFGAMWDEAAAGVERRR